MTGPLFPERPIAVIWDFDKTLIPGSMQTPLFEHFDVDEARFWKEADRLPEFYANRGLEMPPNDTLYLNQILSYVRNGIFPDLDNRLLHKLGGEISFYAGLPDFLVEAQELVAKNELYRGLDIRVEHYVVSTGLRQMILGSKIADKLEYVWACEFVEQVPPPGYIDNPPDPPKQPKIEDIGFSIDNTTKTRAIFEINRGVNRDRRIHVDAPIAEEDRRVPFENMIYIADGPSDVPVFSIINRYRGRTYGVYKPESTKEFEQASRLNDQGRVQAFGEADYRPGKQTSMWILRAISAIADRLVQSWRDEREEGLRTRVGEAPRHLGQDESPAPETQSGEG